VNTRIGDSLWYYDKPYYIYRDATSESYHASYMGECNAAYELLGSWRHHGPPIAKLDLTWPRDYSRLPIRTAVEPSVI